MTGLVTLGIGCMMLASSGGAFSEAQLAMVETPPGTFSIASASPEFAVERTAKGAPVEEYTMRLFRPARTGQKMRLRGVGVREQSMTTSAGGGEAAPGQGERVQLDFDAEAEVVQVNRRGQPVHVRYSVTRCALTKDGATREIAPAGSTLTARCAEGGGDTLFAVNGSSVDESARQALSMLIALENDGITEDDVLGTDRGRAVGESWPVNRKMAVRKLQPQTDTTITPDNVTGVSTLAGVATLAGQPCMIVQSRLSVENVVPGLTDLPPGFTLESGGMTLTMQRYYPENERLPVLSESGRMEIEFVLSGEVRPGVAMETTHRVFQLVEMETTPLARSASAEPAPVAE